MKRSTSKHLWANYSLALPFAVVLCKALFDSMPEFFHMMSWVAWYNLTM